MEPSENANAYSREDPNAPLTDSASPRRVSNPTKEAWILDSLKKRRTEFLAKEQIRTFVGSWNVNGKPPPTDTKLLSSWLGFVPDGSQVELDDLPELVILGFQELDVRAEAFVYNNS
ncbi:hypothetical protein IWW55_006677, partial [Coemansia sp. RSA 2706]